ncbi:hypothetical protein Bca4012_041113 [Brassica carinata]|uniref:Uncharacterized protein n=3 Tax=Brassica TaxID=3705 RepID=A0A0D3E157_BRAOL|nr:unnamed protein product [Brassica napus]CDY53339.1 BnaCnng24970D [Brassica napus]VDD28205.1 unnamed protein product [Brassica oleracea]
MGHKKTTNTVLVRWMNPQYVGNNHAHKFFKNKTGFKYFGLKKQKYIKIMSK